MATRSVVAVINTSPDIVEMLRGVLQHAGLVVVSAFTHQIRDGVIDFGAFMRQHNPSAVVYDIAPPYDANWGLFEHLRAHETMAECPVVITSTHAAYVQKVAGHNHRVYEIIGRPLDLDEIVRAVKDAVWSRPTR